MGSAKWWEELIDFSKNFDNFEKIDEQQKSNISKKLQELEPSPDLASNISAVFNRLCWNYVVGKDLSNKEKEQLKYNDNEKVKFLTYDELEDLFQDFCKNHPQYNGILKKLKEIKVDKKEHINFSNEVVQYIGFVFPNAIICSGNLKNVDFSYSIFLKGIHFHGATFSESVVFYNAIFSESAVFYNAIFSAKADFYGAKFSQTANFRGAKFSQYTDFCDAKFSQYTNFSSAVFSKTADFCNAKFSQYTNFREAEFSEDADFSDATFSQTADFRDATFSKIADFRKAEFSQDAYFRGAAFSENADFREAEFYGHSYFNNSEFKRGAYFQKVIFSKRVPEFLDAELKEDTSFSGVQWPKKVGTYGYLSLIKKIFKRKGTQYKEEAKMQARAYGRLSLIMEGLKRKEDKLFFFTKKMVLQRLLEKGFIYKAFNHFYEKTSNYGNSLARSLGCFVGTGVLFVFFYYLMIYLCSSCNRGIVNYGFEALKVSLSNMLFFSSLLRLEDKVGYLKIEECVIKLIESNILFSLLGIVQIFLGSIFLFLLLLTLRNKSRIF